MRRSGDFNNDGFDDLAIGVPQDLVNGVASAGGVNILRGSFGGLTSFANQYWAQDSAGMPGVGQVNDRFGSSLAAGDFNGDGFSDLVITVPREDIGALVDAGVVHALYGGAAGLGLAGTQVWSQNTAGVPDVAEGNDQFGNAVAVGDFNNDGFDDLAIGVSFESVGALLAAGAVNVLRGSAGGLTAAGSQVWSQNSAGVLGASQAGDQFGHALVAADFNGDGFDDLAIGIIGEDIGAAANAGAVSVLRGSAAGLTAVGNQLWSQNSAGVGEVAELADNFDQTLAAGDFNGDGFADLAVGVAGEDIGALVDAGAVQVLRGSAAGLTAAGNQVWTQNSPGVLDVSEANDEFGAALAVGDFNGDGFDDLAIGAPNEAVGAILGAGAVHVLRGSAAGLTAAGNQLWTQDSAGVLDLSEAGDRFGTALIVGDFNNDGFDDLAIGVIGEDLGAVNGAGAAAVLFGSAAGLTAAGNQLWGQDSPGIGGVATPADGFGWAFG